MQGEYTTGSAVTHAGLPADNPALTDELRLTANHTPGCKRLRITSVSEFSHVARERFNFGVSPRTAIAHAIPNRVPGSLTSSGSVSPSPVICLMVLMKALASALASSSLSSAGSNGPPSAAFFAYPQLQQIRRQQESRHDLCLLLARANLPSDFGSPVPGTSTSVPCTHRIARAQGDASRQRADATSDARCLATSSHRPALGTGVGHPGKNLARATAVSTVDDDTNGRGTLALRLGACG